MNLCNFKFSCMNKITLISVGETGFVDSKFVKPSDENIICKIVFPHNVYLLTYLLTLNSQINKQTRLNKSIRYIFIKDSKKAKQACSIIREFRAIYARKKLLMNEIWHNEDQIILKSHLNSYNFTIK